MIRDCISGVRLGRLLLIVSLAGSASLRAQDPRDSLVEAALGGDVAQRVPLLIAALDPALGPPHGAWSSAVQLLAQTLIERNQDSAAAVWLGWAIRLSPDLQPDTVQFVPSEQVLAAYRTAHEFVSHARSGDDTLATTTWLWVRRGTGQGFGQIQVTANALTVPLQVSVVDVGVLRPGASASLAPGSYEIHASAVGYDSVRVVREVLPQITTVVDFRPRSAPVTARRPAVPQPLTVAPKKKKGFPWVLAALGAGGAGLAVALLAGHGDNQPTTGGITFTFPNP